MSAVAPGALPQGAVHAKAISIVASAAVTFGVFLLGFVIDEPAPYELYMVGLIAVWGLFGLRISRQVSILLALLVLFNIGGMISITQMADIYDAPLYIAISVFLAFTSVFFAAILEADHRRYRLIFMALIAAAMATGEPRISAGFFGEIARKAVFTVILPIQLAPGTDGVLILTQDAEQLSGSLASQNLRGGWNAVLVDGKGTVLASSYMSSDIGKPFFLAGDHQPVTSTVRNSVMFEGRQYETIRSSSPVSGWETIVWAPTSVVQAPMSRSLRILALGGLAIITIGAILAWALGRQITRPIQRLSRDARRLGAGEHVDAVDYPVTEIATVSLALSQASIDRQAAENEIRFLMREVAHRSKNQLTVVSSIAKQTARYARTFAAFQDAFQKRVHGLARSTDLLIAGGVAGVELRELLHAQIEPFRPSEDARLDIRGPEFRLSNQAAQTLGLAIHELATNAAKYGAFSTSTGRLVVSWKRSGDKLDLIWREHVSRLRRRPESRGFGTEMIERMLGGTLEAEISRVLHRDGLECRFVMPLVRLQPDFAEDEDGAKA